jgi:hypothetical protein
MNSLAYPLMLNNFTKRNNSKKKKLVKRNRKTKKKTLKQRVVKKMMSKNSLISILVSAQLKKSLNFNKK